MSLIYLWTNPQNLSGFIKIPMVPTQGMGLKRNYGRGLSYNMSLVKLSPDPHRLRGSGNFLLQELQGTCFPLPAEYT
jgi:hypothetical protein